MNTRKYDYIIFGAGIFGLYAAKILGERGFKVIVLEADSKPLQRASYINQARVHNGYHYPRSITTAAKSAQYYERFSKQFDFAIYSEFKKVYAISKYDSLTNAEQFQRFCQYVDIPAEEINTNQYFKSGMIEAAFETLEYTYDAAMMRNWFVEQFSNLSTVTIVYNSKITQVQEVEDYYNVFANGELYTAKSVINATYASINQILKWFNYDFFNTKFELCEVIMTKTGSLLENVGITLMDGPFFSIMPFGLTGNHSLTSVSYTPHESSTSPTPNFSCQRSHPNCSESFLQNCNSCSLKPSTNWSKMNQLAKKYLNSDIKFEYDSSLYAVKTVMYSAEVDDSRPTVIKKSSENPQFISVLSGKFNTIYDLEEILL